MPELPDLLYIQAYLARFIRGRTITHVVVRQPLVLRSALDAPAGEALAGKKITHIDVHGPFLCTETLSGPDVILNLMLKGRLQHQRPDERAEPYLCISFLLDDATLLNLCDEQRMAKCYVVPHGNYVVIPQFSRQGIDIRSPAFTSDLFRGLAARHSRKQVRVFIHSHTILSAIGNAYADEILFDARIHPKTFVGKLSGEQINALYTSIRTVLDDGIRHVQEAGQPIHVKVRDHMKVRMRRGDPCPRCGTKIRREGVRGYDVFFCPTCQPSSRKLFIDWRKV